MTRGKCPACRGVAIKDGNKFWPFCRERCHLVDLGRWLNEEYRVPERADSERAGDGTGVPRPPGDDEN